VGFNVGILYAYAVGTAGHYTALNLACLAIPILSVLLFMWMPETPQYLLSKDNREGAAASLQWLRGKGHNVEDELQQLKVSSRIRVCSTSFLIPSSSSQYYSSFPTPRNPTAALNMRLYNRSFFKLITADDLSKKSFLIVRHNWSQTPVNYILCCADYWSLYNVQNKI
jgi:hypothetical protein